MKLLKRKHKQKGMTLIEVMVVIASSLVLAGVIFSGGKVMMERSRVQESKELVRAIRESLSYRLISYDDGSLNNGTPKPMTWVPGWDTRSNSVKNGLKGSFGNVFFAGVFLFSATVHDAYAIILTEVPANYCAQLISELSTEADLIALSLLTGGQQVITTGTPVVNAPPFKTWIDPQTARSACDAMGPLVSIHFIYMDEMRNLGTTAVQPNYNPPPPSGLPLWTP